MKWIRKGAWAFYLGGALAWAGCYATDWKFYIVFIPTACLVILARGETA